MQQTVDRNGKQLGNLKSGLTKYFSPLRCASTAIP
ncbi:hypothetical protein SF123566_3291, partial [Shigella flexneri 1235-66]